MAARGFAPFFNSTEFSDVILRTTDRDLQAHKIVLAARCPYFARAFRSGRGESTTGVFDFTGEDSLVMADVFLFIYQRKWDVSKTTLCHYLDMYSQAEYFELEDLKDLAENAIRQNVRDKTMTADFRESIKRAYNYEVPDAKELQHLLTVPAAQNWQMLKMQRAFMSFVKEDGNLDFNRQLMKMLNLPPLPTKSQDNDVAVLKKNLLQPRKKTGSGPGPGRPRKVTVLRASASGNN